MLNPVTLMDYEARYGDVPEGEASDQLTEKLDDAWEVLVALLPSLPSRIESGAITQRLLAKVVTQAVNRSVLNPKGFVSEATGPFSYRLNEDSVSGSVGFTDAELALLGRRKRSRTLYLGTRWPNWAGEC